MEKQALYIDPRTKLFLLLVMNIVMLDTSSGVLLPYLRFIIGFLPFVLLLTSKRFKPAWVYLVIYLISHIIVLYVLDYTSGFMMMLLGFLSSMGTKFLPGGMLGVYFFCSTRVNEFIASMERMHVSQKVIIPVSVMFRFFTTVKEEAEGIIAVVLNLCKIVRVSVGVADIRLTLCAVGVVGGRIRLSAEVNVLHNHLNRGAVLAVLVLILAALQASINSNQSAFLEILADKLGGLFPCGAGNPVWLAVAVGVFAASITSQRE